MPVIFKEDWVKYGAIADTSTRNRSFVHMARVLKAMGVENHMFMLALLDRDLIGVDPHDPNITADMIVKVTRECYLNPWYFFREVVKAPGESGVAARSFEANRGNMALFWSFLNGMMVLIIQSRQTGKSFSSDCMLVWLLQVRSRNLTINILTKDEKLRKSNVDRLKRIMGALPRYLDARTSKDANNTELVTVMRYENKVYTHLPSADKRRADNAARGMTSAVALIDEPPYQPNIDISLPVALSSGGAARELAESVGDPSGTILTTTAGKKDTREGAFIYKLMTGMAPWTEFNFDAENRAMLIEMVEKASADREFRVAIIMDHRQLGKTDEWLKGRMSKSISTGEGADRDYFNRWTSGTATNPLSVKSLKKINDSIREPKWVERTRIGNYMVRWHIDKDQVPLRMAMNHHIVVFDTSDAASGDAISMRVTDLYTGQLMAAATINDTNIITFAEWTATWVTQYENTTILMERKSTGSSCIDMLLRMLPAMGIDPYKRIWNRIVNDPYNYKDRYEEAQWPLWRRQDEEHYARVKTFFGFITAGSGLGSRKALYGEVLQAAARQVGHLTADKETVSQISSLIQKNGRVDHPAGQHDDMVISWILTHWFVMKAQNLSYYGIDATALLREVREVSELTPVERLRDSQQRALRGRIEELSNLMKSTTDEIMLMRYEQEIRLHYSRMEFRENDRVSVDEVIQNAREERRRRRYVNDPKSGSAPPKTQNSVLDFHDKIRAYQMRVPQMSGFTR